MSFWSIFKAEGDLEYHVLPHNKRLHVILSIAFSFKRIFSTYEMHLLNSLEWFLYLDVKFNIFPLF